MYPTLEEFIKEHILENGRFIRASSFIKEPSFDVLYVRMGFKHWKGNPYSPVLTLATVEVEPGSRGRGLFSALIQRVRNTNPLLHIHAECAHKRLGDHLVKMGFIPMTNETIIDISGDYLLKANTL